ncbi:phage Gp37/Gp68 family protein [Comamonas fluminis]|uniref:phage Gp37/Gp68 family protein n=1 Tax=Comamonas fluminis TaxID=2796366 RepID=UPI001C43EE6F|nr:phage Gp37/Gp68 family protein [Comamonas fluminis]
MAENTKIEWTDHTFNPWEGCQEVGPGCKNCYAELRNARFAGGQSVNFGPGAPRRRTSASNWNKPLKWNKQAELLQAAWDGFKKEHPDLTDDELIAKGFIKPRRPRVFCASLADVFDNAVDPQWRADLFSLIAQTSNLDWLLLTKRIGNVKPMLAELAHGSDPDLSLLDMMPLPNVWLGATVVNQEEADRDIPKLLAMPAKVRFLSMEPLLGPVNLVPYLYDIHLDNGEKPVDWVIVGGETGPGARPMHPGWARSLRDQCAAANVPFLFKQWGDWSPGYAEHGNDLGYDAIVDATQHEWPEGHCSFRVGKKAAGRLLDGRTWDEFPVT